MTEAIPPTTPRRLVPWTANADGAYFGPNVGFVGTLAIFGLAWLGRVAVNDLLPPGFPYVTFFPAVVLTAFLFGVRFGSLSALLCGLVAWYYSSHPSIPSPSPGRRWRWGFMCSSSRPILR